MSNKYKNFISPTFFSASTALTIVPPLSIISSTIIQVLFFTSPMIFITSDLPGAGLLLSMIARSAFILVAKDLVLATPPTSGETQINFLDPNFLYILQTKEQYINYQLVYQKTLVFGQRANLLLRL